MIEPRWVILGLLMPALLSAATLAGTTLPRRRTLTPRLVAVGWALAIATGWTLGYLATGGVPGKPWNTGENWLLPIGVAAAMLATTPGQVPLQLSLRLALVVGICIAMMQPAIQHAWSIPTSAAWVSGGAVVAWCCTELVVAVERRRPGRDLPVALALTAAAAGLVTAMTDSITVDQFGLVLAAVLAGGAATALLLPAHLAPRGHAAVAMPLLTAVLLFGTHSSDLHMRYAATLLAAPALAWVAELPALRRRPPWQIVALRLAAVLLPVAVILAIVVPRFVEEMRSLNYY